MSEFDAYHKWLGILPEEQPPHLYRLLGLTTFEDDLEVIEAAIHRQMAHLNHCERGEHAKLARELKREVSQAELFLLDPQAKTEYDELLREYFARVVAAEWQQVEAAEADAAREVPTAAADSVEPLWLEEAAPGEAVIFPDPMEPSSAEPQRLVRIPRRSRTLSAKMFLFNFLLSHLMCVGIIAAWWWFFPETFPTRLAELIEALAPKSPGPPPR